MVEWKVRYLPITGVLEFSKGKLSFEIKKLPIVKITIKKNEYGTLIHIVHIPDDMIPVIEKIFLSVERRAKIKKLEDEISTLRRELYSDETTVVCSDYSESLNKHVTEYRVFASGELRIIETGKTMEELEADYLEFLES